MDLMKKGIVFTIISILVAGFFIIVFSAKIDVPLDAKVDSVSFRVSFLNNYRQNWEDYTAMAVRTSSYMAFSQLTDWMDANNQNFADTPTFKARFSECMVAGNITYLGPTESCSGLAGPTNYTLAFWLNNIADLAWSNLSINTSYKVNEVDMYQTSPFYVTMLVNMSYYLEDAISSVNKTMLITETISIEGLRDPLGTIRFGAWNHFITETGIKAENWSQANFTRFVSNSEFRYHEDAPSYLQRFVEDYSASSCCGIESVLENVPDQGNSSFVDHEYFEYWNSPAYECEEVYTIDWYNGGSDPGYTQLDFHHLASYNVDDNDWLFIPDC
ncbi:hypothetical protein ACFL1B_06350 [Nanoarchaeota archaeon]